MGSNDLCIHDLPGVNGLGIKGGVGWRRWQDHANALRSLNNVSIGDDVSIRIDYDSRSDGTLRENRRRIILTVILSRAVPGNHDLDNRGGHLVHYLFDRAIQLSQYVRRSSCT